MRHKTRIQGVKELGDLGHEIDVSCPLPHPMSHGAMAHSS